jgi:hypothetical protein
VDESGHDGIKGTFSVLAWERSATPRKPENNRSMAQDLNTGPSKYEATLGMVRVKKSIINEQKCF